MSQNAPSPQQPQQPVQPEPESASPASNVPETPAPQPKRTRVYETLSPEQRRERGRAAAAKRWAPASVAKVDWEAIPLEEGLAKLAELSAELDSARAILTRRHDAFTHDQKVVKCFGCAADIEVGKQAGSRTRHNPETMIMETAYACSAACFLMLSRDFPHARTRTTAAVVGTEATKV